MRERANSIQTTGIYYCIKSLNAYLSYYFMNTEHGKSLQNCLGEIRSGALNSNGPDRNRIVLIRYQHRTLLFCVIEVVDFIICVEMVQYLANRIER